MRIFARISVFIFVGFAGLKAQTTQGLISGRILDSVTGQPVAGANVSYSSVAISASGTLHSDASGFYFLPLLSAGTYTIRAGGDKYQPQELQQLELPVAGRIQLDFRLRPLSDVWESGQYRSVFLPGTKTIVTLYGPDVDPSRSGTFEAVKGQRGTLDTSASYVIDPGEIGDLPLLGRDVYAMLVSLPVVGADSATGRGLGVSVAGQRPSSSNYLLDGVENDNYLITGPLITTSPEAIQEYRISTNNYSAEYGRTAGFVANAVTRAGSAAYHGIGYEYLKNTALDAADFQDNLIGAGRLPDRENQFGYQVGGPVIPTKALRNRLFFSSALDYLISHSNQAPQKFLLPTTSFISGLTIPSSRLSYQLLTQYPGPKIVSTAPTAIYTVAPPVIVDRLNALERGDYTTKGGRDHFMARLAINRTTEPDFIWTPYPQFISPLYQDTTGIAGNWQRSWTPRITSELKFSFTDDDLWWNRPHPEIPTINSSPDAVTQLPLTLPGSPAYYEYRNHNRTPEIIYSTVWTRNKHVITAGLGLLFRFNSGYLTAGRDSEYLFSNAVAFAFDQPYVVYSTVGRLTGQPLPASNYNQSFRYTQSYFFVQDSFRVTPRFTLNFGIRYENFGAPSNTSSTPDVLLNLGAGGDFTTRLSNATLTTLPVGQQLYHSDNKDWAPRFGFSWDPFGKSSKTLIRGGFGIFYDRPFDNLWQNLRNNAGYLSSFFLSGTVNYLQPVANVIKGQQPSFQGGAGAFPNLTLFDGNLKNGYTQTSFLGVQRQIGDNLTIEANGTSALGRDLITTDLVNRQFTTLDGLGYPNQNLPIISWRSSQGLSDYYALSTLVRYRIGSTLMLQGAYTWSHSIDNQSDALIGDFFNLSFASITSGSGGPISTFNRQYDSNGDRGNSAFDQRHNLFLIGTWQPVTRWRPANGWKFAYLAAFRTGTPYTVNATAGIPDSGGVFENQTANLLNPSIARYPNPLPGPGGVYLLNPAAFSQPGDNFVGTVGRNEFIGPGLYSLDVSLARTFSVPKLREGTALTFRADFYNVLNHANLNNPDTLITDTNFGLATYGRQGTPSGFPATAPLNETARQIQLLVRLTF